MFVNIKFLEKNIVTYPLVVVYNFLVILIHPIPFTVTHFVIA
jgi:hypothetical protein